MSALSRSVYCLIKATGDRYLTEFNILRLVGVAVAVVVAVFGVEDFMVIVEIRDPITLRASANTLVGVFAGIDAACPATTLAALASPYPV